MKVQPGRKYRTMLIDATMTRNSTHTTVVRVDGREQELGRGGG